MKGLNHQVSWRWRAFMCVTATAFICAPHHARASSIDYGDFAGDQVMYRQVTENSVTTDPTEGLGIYGTPTLRGDTLDFNVPSFFALADGDNVTDVADGLITFGLEPLPGLGMALSRLAIREFGSVNFFTPFGGSAAANVETPVFMSIYEVMVDDGTNDGLLIPLTDPVVVESSLEILSDQAIAPGWNSDDHPNTISWVAEDDIDLVQMVIDELPSIDDQFPLVGVTQFQFSMNNTLTAAVNHPVATSFIDKKHVEFRPTVAVVPEPEMTWLLLTFLWLWRVRRASR